MTRLKLKVISGWLIPLMMLFAVLSPQAQSSTAVIEHEGMTIVVQLCSPSGEITDHTISLDTPIDMTIGGGHCLFCILPSDLDVAAHDVVLITFAELTLSQLVDFPPYVHVPTQHDRWIPHHATAPPLIL